MSTILAFNDLLSRIVVRRDAVAGFEEFLRMQTDWSTSPASTRFRPSKEGGLVEHALNVVNTLLRLRETLAPDLSEESTSKKTAA